jgi:signal transduction histidine kinase
MLSFSGKSRFHLQSIDLIKIIESQVQIFKSTISEAITIQIEIPSELPEILADMGQIRHLLMSLLNNAAEAIGAISGGITIRAGVTQLDKAFLTRTIVDDDLPEGTYIFIVITDNGCGISEVNIKKIFDPFYSTKFTGRGLGLSSVLGIVRGHKGAIKVESQLDKGSTFSVYFPC